MNTNSTNTFSKINYNLLDENDEISDQDAFNIDMEMNISTDMFNEELDNPNLEIYTDNFFQNNVYTTETTQTPNINRTLQNNNSLYLSVLDNYGENNEQDINNYDIENNHQENYVLNSNETNTHLALNDINNRFNTNRRTDFLIK